MSPEINNGDVVTIYKYESSPKIGDIVLILNSNNEYRLHRIVGISDLCFFTKGDNSYYFDKSININSIIGFYKLVDEYIDKNIISILIELSFLVGKLSSVTSSTNDEFYITIASNIIKQIKIIKRRVLWHECNWFCRICLRKQEKKY